MKKYKTRIDIEYDVNSIERTIREEHDLPVHWYGDSYGSLIESPEGLDLLTCCEYARDEEEYQKYLDEIEENFKMAAISYVNNEKDYIIEYAMNRIGTNDISILDGMTLCYNDRYYNIYVDNGVIEIDEI